MAFTLNELGWGPHFENQVSDAEKQQFRLARVAAHFGSQVLMLTERGELHVPTAILENEKLPFVSSSSSVAVGDWYLVTKKDGRAIRQLDRKTLIARKAPGEEVKTQLIASNVDSVFVVSSCNQDFNPSRLERYLALVLESGATPIVVLTKADLGEDGRAFRREAESLHAGVLVETLDARDPDQTQVLDYWCSIGKTVALVGSSGVGKSTLANTMGGFDLRTQSIRQDDDKGRHTTTARSMHRLRSGGWLVDTPGMRELQVADCEDAVSHLFDDVLAVAQKCRFRNCRHDGDSGCAIDEAIKTGELDHRRFKSYQKLLSEQARNRESLADRRAKDRKTGKLYKSIIQDKRNRRY